MRKMSGRHIGFPAGRAPDDVQSADKWWMKYPDLVMLKEILDSLSRWFSRRSLWTQTFVLGGALMFVPALVFLLV